jgi:hypothetical protein
MHLLLFVLFLSAIASVATYLSSVAVAVYALSFWHYYVYWLAYLFRAVPLAAFKRDAIMMKCVSIAVLAWAFLSEALDFISLTVVTLGFALNTYAAIKLGSDRSYYGYEIGGLPHQRITSFPYSMTAHPMLIGNIVAFSGTLINADFREHWWPLAVGHAAMNVGLLIMETTISADSKFIRSLRATSVAARYVIGIAVLALGAAIGYAAGGPLHPAIGALVGLIGYAYALALFSLYSIGERENAAHHTISDRNVT